MSLKAMTWVWENSPYQMGARLVHLCLADKANDDHDYELWMYQSKIAERSALSVSQVYRILKQMVEEGYLELLEQGGGRSKPSRYRLVIKTLHGAGLSDINPCIGATENPAPMRNTPSLTQEITKGGVDTNLVGFDYFWDVYPKRNGRKLGRGLCEARWVKLNIETRRAAYRGAVNYRKDCDAGLTIAKDPDRWLRDACWKDWQTPTVVEEKQELTISEDYYL